MRAVVIGSVTIDHQVRAAETPRMQVGGTALYGAAALRAAGWDVVAVANVADADRPEAERRLGALGVALRAGASRATTTFRNRLGPDGDRSQDLLATADPIALERCAELLDSDLVHFGPLHGADVEEAVFRAARGHSAVALDAQGLLRASMLGAVRTEVAAALPDALDAARFVKLAAREAEALECLWHASLEEIAARHGVAEMVITRGGEGGFVLVAGSRRPYAAALAGRVADATGAGDVFFATYVAARLVDAEGVEHAAARAAEVAARHVAGAFLHAEPQAR